jgi:gentisate 1,2-dioxygenase
VQLEYANPETGGACLNTLAFSAYLVRPGQTITLPCSSPSRVFHVVDGLGEAEVNGTTLRFEQSDTFCAPGFSRTRIANRSSARPLFLVSADESPIHRKLGYYEERRA